jgi:hypothetical protein
MTLRAAPDIPIDLVDGLPGMPMPIVSMMIVVSPVFEVGREFSDHLRRRFGTTW